MNKFEDAGERQHSPPRKRKLTQKDAITATIKPNIFTEQKKEVQEVQEVLVAHPCKLRIRRTHSESVHQLPVKSNATMRLSCTKRDSHLESTAQLSSRHPEIEDILYERMNGRGHSAISSNKTKVVGGGDKKKPNRRRFWMDVAVPRK